MAKWVAGGGDSSASAVDWVNVKTAGGAVGNGSTNDTAALQEVINANAGKVIYFPAGTYNITQLLLPDNTTLDLGVAVLRRTSTGGSGANASIRNADFAAGNSNITIRGGTLTSAAGASGRVWHMENVSGLRVQNLTIEKGASTFADFMLPVYASNDVRIDNCRILGGTAVGEDGIHIKSSQRVTISDCLVESGDDSLVLVHEFNQTEPLKNVTITNCVLSSRSAHYIRVSVMAGETQVIEDVVMSGIVCHPPDGGTVSGNAVLVNDATNGGRVRRVTMDNITVNATGKAGNAVNITNVTDSTFSNWRVAGASNRSFLVTNCHRLDFNGCVADTPAPTTGNPQWAITGGSTHIRSIGCVSRDARIWGWVVNGAGTADISFVGCSGIATAQADWTIGDSAARVSFMGCTGGRIEANATTPPVGLKVVGCHLTHASAPIVNPPADLTYVGNTDAASRGNQLPGTKLGFYGTTPVAKPTGTPAAATDAATTQALVNDLRAKLIVLGLIG